MAVYVNAVLGKALHEATPFPTTPPPLLALTVFLTWGRRGLRIDGVRLVVVVVLACVCVVVIHRCYENSSRTAGNTNVWRLFKAPAFCVPRTSICVASQTSNSECKMEPKPPFRPRGSHPLSCPVSITVGGDLALL